MRLTTSMPAFGQRPDRPLRTGDLVRAGLTILFVVVCAQLVWSARLLILTAFLGVLFGLSAARVTDWICARVRFKRPVVAALVVFGAAGLLLLIFAWTFPTLVEQSQDLRTKLPEAAAKFEAWVSLKQPKLLEAIAPATADGSSRLVAALQVHTPAITNFAFGIVQSALTVAAGLVMVIFLALYIAADPTTYRHGLLLLIPVDHRDRIGVVLTSLGATLRTWFATQLIAMVVIGVVTTVILALIGVRGALPLGVIAGIFEFIPNIGPVLSAVPAILMGFAESPEQAGVIVLVYWGIQFLENNLLIPYLMSEQLDLPPALTLITQVVMAFVFGFLGLFVAIPILAVVVVAVRAFWVEDDLPPLPDVEMTLPTQNEL
jgi:predicted PurR-regulated permease PerM